MSRFTPVPVQSPLSVWPQNPVNRRHPLTKGLTHWYKTFPNQGGATWWNLIGQADHAALVNMEGAADVLVSTPRLGGWAALNLDGTNEYAKPARNPGSTGVLSVAFWARFVNVSQTKVSLYLQTSATDALCAYTVAGTSILYVANQTSSATGSLKSLTALSNNTWYHFVVTKTTGSITGIYLNGVSDSQANAVTLTLGTTNFLIGAGGLVSEGDFPMQGQIDDVMCWPGRSLNAAEVWQLYQEARAYFPTMLRRWTDVDGRVPAAAGGLSIPVAMHSYRQRRVMV